MGTNSNSRVSVQWLSEVMVLVNHNELNCKLAQKNIERKHLLELPLLNDS